MSNSLSYIYQHPLLSEEDLEKIFEQHREVKYGKNEFLLKEGEVANEYYILESGLVRSFVHNNDQEEITTEFFCENEIVIVASSLFQRIPSIENLQTITECTLWKIDYEDFERLFDEIEGFKDWGRLWFSFELFNL